MNIRLNRFAIFVAFSTWFLIVAGAMVTSTGSGLSVPDWPLSFGQWMPPMVGGVIFEHSHRVIAGTVACLTAILCGWILFTQQPRAVKYLGLLAVAAVLLQALLGGITVLYGLPKIISVLHAVLAQTFLCLCVSIAVLTSPAWSQTQKNSITQTTEQFSFLIKMANITVVLIYVQLILGAILRHSGSRMYLNLHMWNAIVVLAAIVILFKIIFKNFRNIKSLLLPAIVLKTALLLQIILGIMTFLPLIGQGIGLLQWRIPIVTAHVAVGALMLVSSLLIALWAHQYQSQKSTL